MELLFTKELLLDNEKLFLSINEKYISDLFKEIIIVEIILNNTPNLTSLDIQNAFEVFFNSNKHLLPKELFAISNSSAKSRLRVMLNNLVSSNIDNKGGLRNRKEITINKNRGLTFTPSQELLSFFDDKDLSCYTMIAFCKRFPYIYKYLFYSNNREPNCIKGKCKKDDKDAFIFIFNEKPCLSNIGSFKPTNLKWICNSCFIAGLLNEVYSV